MEFEKPLVSVICTTYNHAPYIAQTLDGFVAQRCDFPFEVIVHDDASTDGTADIIRAYCTQHPALFRPILQEQNQYSQGNDICDLLYFQKSCGRYIAFCEGDDYWTDPLKLQKQVDFLESHADYGLIYAQARIFNQSSQKMGVVIGTDRCDLSSMLCCNPIPTVTALFRRDLLVSYFAEIRPIEQQWKMGDYPLWLYIAAHSKVWFMNEVVAVYRVLLNSASHSTDPARRVAFIENAHTVKHFFAQKYAPELKLDIERNSLIELLPPVCKWGDPEGLKKMRQRIRALNRQKGANLRLRCSYLMTYTPTVFLFLLDLIRRLR